MNRIDKLPDDAVKIVNSEDYVDKKGNIYSIDNRSGHSKDLFIREQVISNGYKYCNIRYYINGKYKNITNKCGAECDDCASIFENDLLYTVENILRNNETVDVYLIKE